VIVHGSNKESSSQEGNKEDRKEKITFPLHTRTQFFRAGGDLLQPSFCGLHRYETLSGEKIQAEINNVLKYKYLLGIRKHRLLA
jgi:hypothetical protein